VIPKKAIPSQQEADLNNPEEHFIWALRSLPMVAGSGMMTFSPFLRGWSAHLWKCGFSHRDYLEGLADADGNIHVSQLPKQVTKFQEAFRGPHHSYNPAARWVEHDTPDPEPFTVPNIKEMTTQEKYALAYQLKHEGIAIPDAPKPMTARVVH
jgi:hypothetical protein